MVARQTGMEVHQQDRGGCSFVNLLRASPADCQDFIEDALSTIESEARPGDIVLLAALRMPELRGFDWQQQDAQQVYRQLLAERTPTDAQAARDERLGQHLGMLAHQFLRAATLQHILD